MFKPRFKCLLWLPVLYLIESSLAANAEVSFPCQSYFSFTYMVF